MATADDARDRGGPGLVPVLIWAGDGSADSLRTMEIKQPAKRTPPPLTDEEEFDLRTLAKTDGHDPEVMIAGYAGVPEFETLTTALAEDRADIFTAAGVDGPPGGKKEPWILFTDLPDLSTLDRIGQLALDVEVRWGAPASETEYEELSVALLKELRRHTDASLTTQIDVQDTMAITITAASEAPAVPAAAIDAALNAAGVASSAARSSPDGQMRPTAPVRYRTPPMAAAREETTVQGGRNLNLWDSNGPECTAGFTAKRNGVKGVLTAKHCKNKLRYGGDKNVIEWVASASPTNSGGPVDLQFMKTLPGHSTNKQFRATGTGGTNDRTVLDVKNPGYGTLTCKWGRTTEYGCGYVVRTNTCVDFSNSAGMKCGISQVDRIITDGGDSGGPWFNGTTAQGIHMGRMGAPVPLTGVVSSFTVTSKVDNISGTKVMED